MDTLGPLVAYLAIKLSAYSLWAAVGLRWLDSRRSATAGRALACGLLRLAVGLVLGWLLALAVAFAFPAANRVGFSVGAFYGLLAVVRWLEWGLVSMVIRRSVSPFGVGADRRDNLWRGLGVVVSCATDAAVLFTVGALGWIPC